MFIRADKQGKRTYYYLVEAIREGSKVRQKRIKYLGTEKPAIIEDRYFDLATGKKTTRLILDIPDMDIEVIDGKLVLKRNDGGKSNESSNLYTSK